MPNFIEMLTVERFGTYRSWAIADDLLASRLYTYNVQLSTALYGPLHMLEVALRNVVDRTLCAHPRHGPDWFDNPTAAFSTKDSTRVYQKGCIDKARETLTRNHKAGTHCQIIAELNLGFWTSLFGSGTPLWNVLRPAFRAPGIQRSDVAVPLHYIRDLRNRIAHYEPILAIALGQHYASITTLTGWLSPSAAAWIKETSTWGKVYPGVPVLERSPSTGQLNYTQAVLPYLPPASANLKLA